MKKNTTAVTLIVAGAALSILLALFIGDFGFWTMPGLFLIAIGAAGLLFNLIKGRAKRPNVLGAGLYILMIGLACFIGTIGHIMLGLAQICACLVMVAGLICIMVGLCAKIKSKSI